MAEPIKTSSVTPSGYPIVAPLRAHDIEIRSVPGGYWRVRVDGLVCPHRHIKKAAAERCLWKWNDEMVKFNRGEA